MKKFSKIKIATLVFAFVLGLSMIGTGIAGAAGYFNFHTTTATVTVNEALTVSCIGGDGAWVSPSGHPEVGTWTVIAYPGETKTLYLRISNVGGASLVATVGEISGTLSGTGDYTVPAGSYVDVTLTLVEGSSVTPGTYSYTITFLR
jgi:hypothetical protein